MVVAFQCNCSCRCTSKRRRQEKWQVPVWGRVVLLLNVISAVHSGLSTTPFWRTVILMPVISNLLLVTWEQHVSYKLLLLVTSSGLNNWLRERENACVRHELTGWQNVQVHRYKIHTLHFLNAKKQRNGLRSLFHWGQAGTAPTEVQRSRLGNQS